VLVEQPVKLDFKRMKQVNDDGNADRDVCCGQVALVGGDANKNGA
jgi:hypothetical protein